MIIGVDIFNKSYEADISEIFQDVAETFKVENKTLKEITEEIIYKTLLVNEKEYSLYLKVKSGSLPVGSIECLLDKSGQWLELPSDFCDKESLSRTAKRDPFLSLVDSFHTDHLEFERRISIRYWKYRIGLKKALMLQRMIGQIR